jgi:hypothetical protein
VRRVPRQPVVALAAAVGEAAVPASGEGVVRGGAEVEEVEEREGERRRRERAIEIERARESES